MKDAPPRSGDSDDADAGVRMLDGAVTDYRTVVQELCTAARGTWTGPQVAPEELAEITGTIRGFNPGAVVETAASASGAARSDALGERLSEALGELGDEGIGKLIGDQLGVVVAEYLEHCDRQEQVLAKATRAMSANATLCRMSGEAAGVTARATLSAIRAQAHMIEQAYLDEDWDCFRGLVGAAATLVDECAHEIWGLCVDRDETMCEGLNHLMTGQAAVAETVPASLTPVAEGLFDSAVGWIPQRSCPEGVAGATGPAAGDVSESGGNRGGSIPGPAPCAGILGAVGIGTALIGVGLIAAMAHDALDQLSCGTEIPDPVDLPESAEPDAAADGQPAPVPIPEPAGPAAEPPAETEKPAQGHERSQTAPDSPDPGPEDVREPKLSGGYPSGEGNPGTARKAGQW